MTVTTTAKPSTRAGAETRAALWLHSRRWDLIFITASVALVPVPYLVYLLGVEFGMNPDVSRNLVNGFIAVAIGGPHMMSTFLRTGLDQSFRKRYPALIWSSVLIPMAVITLAFANLTLLLTVFFFWASMHVLHQITYIVELYNHREHNHVRPERTLNPIARLIDYGVVMSCLFPMAAFKISEGEFNIGVNDLTRVIPDFFEQRWFFVVMSGVFAVALTAYIVKTAREIRGGYVNWPKTVFIICTVAAAFTVPLLDNLDTAFQGLNAWHSFQYLALTFYIIKLRERHGTLEQEAPLVDKWSRKRKDSRGLLLLSTLLLGASAAVGVVVFLLAPLVIPGIDGNRHFDIAYYSAVLCFLWIHYYHDHFLFTNFEALDKLVYRD
jgi:hypothetical protein